MSKPWGESPFDSLPLRGQSLRAGCLASTLAGRCWRVQVKSAHSSAVNGYSFHACGNVHKKRYTPRDIDFIVGNVVPDNVWYVIPIQEFAEKTTVKVFPSSKRRMSRYEKYREAWEHFRPEE